MNKKSKTKPKTKSLLSGYDSLLREVSGYLADAKHTSARAVNSVITATYWMIGRRIVEFEQGGKQRAEYGQALLERLGDDLSSQFGRGFSRDNLETMRLFYMAYSSEMISETPSRKLEPVLITKIFPLSWSHYVLLVRKSRTPEARRFYETEALRGGWSVRQLDRQISTLFYERAAMSKDKSSMLRKGGRIQPGEETSPEEELKDPYMLEFLGLKDEYSENDLEESLVRNLENFLMELGGDFAFVGRQKRLRVGNEWYRVDLVFFHRKLRCLVVIDLKLGKFTHADAGQMHMYLNYARAHWVRQGENPPVGLILCAQKDEAVAQYALEGLPNKVMAAEYRMVLPDEDTLAGEIMKTQRLMEKQGLYQA
jgi:predicted nuclease of restriction endonuclease-like (RecB) superfamily